MNYKYISFSLLSSIIHELPAAATADFCRPYVSDMILEDIPELMQNIQSRLPVKAAARTSVLSKSWLQAWSTIPTLKFYVPDEQERKQLKLFYIDRTLIRYLHGNTPIVRFDLSIEIENGESASLVEKWIRSVATKTCLKELSLTIYFREASFDLPDEILSGENITKLTVSANWRMNDAIWIRTSHHHPPVIKCSSLRELHLRGVRVSQQVLDHILSSCSLLAKIKLNRCFRDHKTIKIKSLPCLDELDIVTSGGVFTSVEIDNVPNLRLFCCHLHVVSRLIRHLPHAYSISLGSSVTQLSLGGPVLVRNYASMDMISGFPFLESLTLDMTYWTSGGFHFTSASMKRLTLLSCPNNLIDVQVNAQKLLFFRLDGYSMPSLSFPISTILDEAKFHLRPRGPFGTNFFLKLREALEISRKCYVHSITRRGPLDIDLLDDLKTRLTLPPAMNVETLSFKTVEDECLWENPLFYDAFFEICHPKHVFARPNITFKRNNHFCKLILKEVLEKKTTTTAYWPRYLKHVQIRTSRHKTWETLSSSHTSLLDGPALIFPTFKLEWC